MPDSSHRLSLSRIEHAARSIDRVFAGSPQFDCEPISERAGCTLTLKIEIANPLRSFKGRGADFFTAQAILENDRGPWTCASAGNFGQAMAYACRTHAIPLTVFVAQDANPLSVTRMRALGADVRAAGEDFEAAKVAARAWSRERGVRFIEDGQEPHIAEGAGTIAVELCERSTFDAVVIPVGDGALITGMARWIAARAPRTRVIGACSSGATAVHDSWRRGAGAPLVSAAATTIADGIAVRAPVAAAVADMHDLVDDIVLVEDAMLLTAMRLLHADAGLMVEPAGAVGLAAILAHAGTFVGAGVATVVTGGNVTREQMTRWQICAHSGS